MTANTAKVSHGASATAIQATLPAGCTAGDVVLVALVNGSTTTPGTVPGTAVITAQAMGTGAVSMSKYTLTSTDITNGYVSCSSGAAINWVAAVFNTGASTAQGAATFAKRASSVATTTAPAATITAGDTTVVMFFGKASSETGGTTAPGITVLDSWFPNAAGAASAEVGYYTGTTSDVVFTSNVASTNGAGVQIGYTPSAAPPPQPAFTWWDGTAEQPLAAVPLTYWDGAAEQSLSSETFV